MSRPGKRVKGGKSAPTARRAPKPAPTREIQYERFYDVPSDVRETRRRPVVASTFADMPLFWGERPKLGGRRDVPGPFAHLPAILSTLCRVVEGRDHDLIQCGRCPLGFFIPKLMPGQKPDVELAETLLFIAKHVIVEHRSTRRAA